MVQRDHRRLSARRQCVLLSMSRSSLYYESGGENPENLRLMKAIDRLSLKHPVYGYRRMREMLKRAGHEVNPKRVARLMKVMGLEAI